MAESEIMAGTMEEKKPDVVPVTAAKAPAVKDEEALSQVHEGDLISLDQVDSALALKMRLVNDVRMRRGLCAARHASTDRSRRSTS